MLGAVRGTITPIGEIVAFSGGTVPGGWLECDGSAVSRSDYSRAFATLGTTWGVGDGTTTFNLPNLRGRTVVGAGTGAGLTARTLGQLIGNETHALTAGQMPAHAHALTTLENADAWGLAVAGGFSDRSLVANNGSGPALNTGSIGSGQAHNNMQPSAVVRWIVYVGA